MAELPAAKGNRKMTREILRFGVIFVVCLAVSGVGYVLLRESEIFVPFLNFNAWLSSAILNLFGAQTEVTGALVSSRDFTFRVTAECTSAVFTAIMAAAVLAWPSRWGEKIIGIVAGAAVLFVMNLVRIITLYYIGAAFPWFLDIAHYFLWQIVLILITLGLWVLWSEKMVQKKRSQEGDTAQV